MRRARTLLAASCILFLTPRIGLHAQRAEVGQVRSAMLGFMRALNALDAKAMSAYFADDITAFVPSAQTDRANGKQAVDAIFGAFVERTKPTTAALSLVPEALQVDASPTLGVVSFQIHEPTTVRRRTFVWRKTNGRWLISHFHASDVPAAKP